MDGHCDGARGLSWEHHDVMTADDPINNKPRANKGSDHPPAVKRRQLAVRHAI
jgi:hypothetical protein